MGRWSTGAALIGHTLAGSAFVSVESQAGSCRSSVSASASFIEPVRESAASGSGLGLDRLQPAEAVCCPLLESRSLNNLQFIGKKVTQPDRRAVAVAALNDVPVSDARRS